ncbi:S41 family peptidase [Tenacibaculum maritimum]|uniref:S41 family peptidase n=1 Tax=Tenacibaculum maritimum TaxID=107401 RepID=UPI0012E56E66|nr:S41 family peptidase [Tenacibaculum maritimum]CAA0179482.1 Probable S41 family peptidase precursor [Tenacibaculum maritimum]
MKKTFTLLFFLLLGKLTAQIALPKTISNEEKIYGLSKFWSEVNYNFVYLNRIDKQRWDKHYQTLLSEVQTTENDYEYYRLLQKFCAELKDGHTNVWLPKNIRQLILNAEFGDYRFYLKNIDGKAVISKINLSKKEEIPIGSEIIEINGMPTQKYLNIHVKPYISTSTSHILENTAVSELLKAPIGTTYLLKIKKPNQKTITLRLSLKKTLEEKTYPPSKKKAVVDFKWLENQIAYLELNDFSAPKTSSIFIKKLPEIRQAKKLIIDLRNNFGGNTDIGTSVLKYLTYDNQLQSSKSSSRLHIPTFKAWGLIYNLKAKDTLQGSGENRKMIRQAYLTTQNSFFHEFPYATIENHLKKSERIVIPIAILIGNYTASAAEDFLIAANNQKHITTIGEPTYGSTGQPMLFNLPGGATARICTKKDTFPNGQEFVGFGIQPDIFVKKSYQDYLNNTDPVLQKAIQYLNKGK